MSSVSPRVGRFRAILRFQVGGPVGRGRLAALGVAGVAGAGVVGGALVVGPGGSVVPAYAWVQLSGGTPVVRAIVKSPGSACPDLVEDGVSRTMTVRAAPPMFTAVTVCEASLTQATAKSLSVGGVNLSVPSGQSSEIVVLGDTGCRDNKQACSGTGANDWGFTRLAAAVTRTSSAPDLILHVGDYFYREKVPCSTSDPCDLDASGKPSVYGWTRWEKDFFLPAETGGLLRHAPWLFVRGNHEDATRACVGYNLFFAPGPWSATLCSTVGATIPPYVESLAGLDVYVIDSSNSDFTSMNTAMGTVYTAMGKRPPNSLSWITTHHPICEDSGCSSGWGNTLSQGGVGPPGTLKWLQVGHVHVFDHLAGSTTHPAQTVSGAGGTDMDPSSMCIVSSTCSTAYTYMVVSAGSSAWTGTLYDDSGALIPGHPPFTVSM